MLPGPLSAHPDASPDAGALGIDADAGLAHPAIARRLALARLASSSLALVAGAAVLGRLAGCATDPSTNTSISRLPAPKWPTTEDRLSTLPGRTMGTPAAPHASTRPLPTQPPAPAPAPALPEGVMARSIWSKGDPYYPNMTRMQTIQRITLHHDGMSAFTATSQQAAAERIEAIRRSHRNMPGWGDIGYHFVIDPAGRVWEARPLSWQGAHVKDQNEGNIGICLLGNYELQRPNDTQLAAMERLIASQMKRYNIPLREVRTHKEMAATACPGKNLQPRLVAMRSARGPLATA
jgi:hypothetical protein